MKVIAQKIIIDRDVVTKVHKEVWQWEIPVYQEKFGAGRVKLLDKFEVEVEALPNAPDEFARLANVFGTDSSQGGSSRPYVEDAYGLAARGGIKELAKTMKASVKRTRKPTVKKKVADKKAA